MAGLILNPNLFNSDRINKIIDENQKGSNEERSGPTVAFIPEGRHTIRWFFDPNADLFREVMIGRVGKKRFVCPDFLARRDKTNTTTYPVCHLDELAKERDDWRAKCRYQCMVYGFLYDTKNPGEYWTAGKPYVILGNSFLRRALVEMLENLRENGMDMLLAMLTPTASGFFSSVGVTKGQQGNVSIQVLTKKVDPIDLGDWYVPLSDVYISNTFDNKVYEEAVAEYLAQMAPSEGGSDGEGESPDEEVVAARSTPTTTSGADLVESAPSTLTPRVATKPKTAAKVVPQNRAELPEGITQAMLPDGCPGWGAYNIALTTCALCPYNVECMTVGDAKS